MNNNKTPVMQGASWSLARRRISPVSRAVSFALSGAFWSGNSNAATPLGCPVTADLDITSDQYIAAPIICTIDLAATLTVTSTAGASLANYGTLNNAGSLTNYGQLSTTGGADNVGIINNTGSLTNAGNLLMTEPVDENSDILRNAQLNNASTLVNSGYILANSGTLNNSGYLYNSGTIRMAEEPKYSFQFGGLLKNTGILVNAGSINTVGDQTLAGSITNLAGGEMNLVGGYYHSPSRIRLNGDVNNAGTMRFANLFINGEFINSGNVHLSDNWYSNARLTSYLHNTANGNFEGGAGFYATASSLLVNDGAFNTSNNYGGLSRFAGHVINHGNMHIAGQNAGIIDSDGVLEIDGFGYGGTGNTASAIINNSGQLTFASNNDGIINNSGNLSLDYGYDGIPRNLGTIRNSGTLTVGQWTDEVINSSVINNSGTVDIAANKSITGTGSFSQTGGETVVNGALVQDTINIAGGTFSGSGTVQATGGDVYFGADATINPGNSPGTLSIFGDTTIEGTFLAEIASDIDYDMLLVSGTATLDDAAFMIELLDGYTVNFQDSFDVLSAQTITGEFSTLLLPELQGELSWNVQYLLSDTGADIMRVTAVPIPGAVWLFGSALALLGWRFKTRA